MNIHFTDKKLLETLINNTVVSSKIGSHMYGLNNESSDNDFLSIYIEDNDNRNSFMWEHHQLQYNEHETNRMFTSLQAFIRNALNGDSTINFEVIHSEEIKYSALSWLWERRNNFINYNIIRSYLGLARRDLKFWRKETNNGKKHNVETNKKLSHFVRGVIFANYLMQGMFSLDVSDTTTYADSGYDDYYLLVKIKNGLTTDFFDEYVVYFEFLMDSLRDELNNRLNNKEIVTYMKVEYLEDLDNTLKNFIKNYSKDINIECIDYKTLLYNALENGITY